MKGVKGWYSHFKIILGTVYELTCRALWLVHCFVVVDQGTLHRWAVTMVAQAAVRDKLAELSTSSCCTFFEASC